MHLAEIITLIAADISFFIVLTLAVYALINALNDGDWYVRYRVAIALGEIEIANSRDVDAFIKVIDKQMPEKYADDAVRVIREMQKADFNVIMGGLGLRYGLKGNYDKFKEMINKMNEVAKVYFIPAGCSRWIRF